MGLVAVCLGWGVAPRPAKRRPGRRPAAVHRGTLISPTPQPVRRPPRRKSIACWRGRSSNGRSTSASPTPPSRSSIFRTRTRRRRPGWTSAPTPTAISSSPACKRSSLPADRSHQGRRPHSQRHDGGHAAQPALVDLPERGPTLRPRRRPRSAPPTVAGQDHGPPTRTRTRTSGAPAAARPADQGPDGRRLRRGPAAAGRAAGVTDQDRRRQRRLRAGRLPEVCSPPAAAIPGGTAAAPVIPPPPPLVPCRRPAWPPPARSDGALPRTRPGATARPRGPPFCVLVGNHLDDFALTGLDGQTWEFRRDPPRKLVLLDFWKTTCPPLPGGRNPALTRLPGTVRSGRIGSGRHRL